MSGNRVDWNLIGQRRRETQSSPTPPPTPPAPRPAATPYPVERFTVMPVERVPYSGRQILQRNDAGVNGLPLSSLASGSIITMWADLVKFGFPENKQDRWFVVFGRLSEEPEPKPYVLLPLATFNHRGKTAPTLPEWAAQFYKEVKRDPGSPDTNNTSTDLNPSQAVYARKHHCAPGEILTLATGFVVRPDDQGNIPAKLDGYLVRQSVDAIFNSYAHLVRDHQEYGYLLETNMPQWSGEGALKAMELPENWGDYVWCSDRDCLYGAMLKSAHDQFNVLKILEGIVAFPDTAAASRMLSSYLGPKNESE